MRAGKYRRPLRPARLNSAVRSSVLLAALFISAYGLLTPAPLAAQHIFAERNLQAPKNPVAPDLRHSAAVAGREFISLQQNRRNIWRLQRTNSFFYDIWQKDLVLPAGPNPPQLFLSGDSAVVLMTEVSAPRSRLSLHLQIFRNSDGEHVYSDTYNIPLRVREDNPPKMALSPNHRRFVLYNYSEEDAGCSFQIFETGRNVPLKTLQLDFPAFESTVATAAHLSDNGDLFFAAADAATFKLYTFYWAALQTGSPKAIENNFFFERPAGHLADLQILRPGPTTYYLAFGAGIGRELTGLHFSAVNVVLNTVLSSGSIDFRAAAIDSLYRRVDGTLFSRKNKAPSAPVKLQDFRVQNAWPAPDNGMVLALERVPAPLFYHDGPFAGNLAGQLRASEERYYRADDLVFLCFDPTGSLRWQQVIPKTQFSMGNPSALSYIARPDGDRLLLLSSDNARRGRIAAFDLNLADGTLLRQQELMSGKLELVKDLSSWLDDATLLICTRKPGDDNRRIQYIVEWK